jgi:DNA-binding SARP family transcriptional activator/tetratricopeptide (TPR) repeat protein
MGQQAGSARSTESRRRLPQLTEGQNGGFPLKVTGATFNSLGLKLEFRVLGSLEVWRGPKQLPLGSHKERALLAILLLNANQTLSRERLVDELWGERAPERAGKAIQTYVSRLRKIVPAEILCTRPSGYVLELQPEQLDVHRFERLLGEGQRALAEGNAELSCASLREALALWRGPALAEFNAEPFGRSEGARLEELRLSALETRVDAELAFGHHADLVGELESLVARHPLRERMRGQLMLAFYRSGRQAEALAAYQDGRRRLVDDLGIEPGRALRDLEKAILQHDQALEVHTPRSKPEDAPAGVRTLAGLGPAFVDKRGPFVGRDRELERLRVAADDALAGRGKLVMLVGEPGIGKTQTAIELSRYAVGRGALVLWGRCYEREGAPSYWPWVQAIRAYVAVCDQDRLRAELGGRAATLAELVPELRERFPELEPPPVLADEKQARFRLLDSLTSFLKRIADHQPLVLVVDDLHAADAGSLMVLEFVAQEVAGTRLLVVGAYRDIELDRGHPLSQTLAELTRAQLLDRVMLRGLTQQDVDRFLTETVGVDPPEELVRTVHARTEGNPLFVTEIVRLLDQEGKLTPEAIADSRDWSVGVPEGVREVIGRRLARLSPDCGEILRLASVVGREFGLDLLARLRDNVSDEELLDAVEEALAARVVEELPRAAGRFRFTHDLVRETLAAELSTTRRVRVHALIAGALEELYGDDAGPHAAELAFHFAEAAPVLGSEKLIRYSRLAGEQAYNAHAYEDAIAHFQQALTAKEGGPMDDETAGLLFALARSEFLGLQPYDLDEALARMRRAFEYYADAGDTDHAIEVVAHLIPPIWGETLVLPVLSRALAMVPPDSLQAGYILASLGRFAGTNDGDYQGACDAFERSLAIARQHGDETLERRVLALAARVDWWHLRWSECVARSTRALQLARAADDEQTEMYARAWLARSDASAGHLAEARAHAAVSLDLADRLRERYWLATARVNALWLDYLEGEWDAARRLSDACLRLQPRDARNLGLRTLLEYQLGETARGEAFLERLLEAMRVTSPGSTVEHSEAAATIALVGRITGRQERFDIAEAAAATVLSSPVHIPLFDLHARIGLAVLATERSDPVAAGEQYAELASQSGTVLLLLGMAADRLLGLLAVTMEEFDTAWSHFEAALSFCVRAGYRPEYARTAFEYAVALRARGRQRDRKRATELQAGALSAARALAMVALEERILANDRSVHA